MISLRDDFTAKVMKIREMLLEHNVSGIVIETQIGFSWLTGGRGFIGLASEMACASILITGDGIYLITTNIEAPRIRDEEIAGLLDLIQIKSFQWGNWSEKGNIIKELLKDGKYITDVALSSQFHALRSQLSSFEILRYETLGKSSAEVVENICKSIKSGVTEFEIAGDVSRELWKLGIEPITIMVAFDERIRNYRHPLPTDNKLKKYAMIVVCTRKWGLVASLSRIVSLGSISEELIAKHRAVTQIDTCFIENTRPGIPVKDIFGDVVARYEKTGFGEEWKLHHQGGATGYNARETIATLSSPEVVLLNQAYAWNPSITGTKSEDTFIVLEKENHIITHTGAYAYIENEYKGKKLLRPDILVL